MHASCVPRSVVTAMRHLARKGNATATMTLSPPPQPYAWTTRKKLRLLPLVIIVALMILAVAGGLHRYASLGAIVEFQDKFHATLSAHRFAVLAAYIIVYATAVGLSLPGSMVFTAAGGMMFGVILGGAAAVVAATTGACIVFLIARSAIGSTMARSSPSLRMNAR